jgi:hypothetical protein
MLTFNYFPRIQGAAWDAWIEGKRVKRKLMLGRKLMREYGKAYKNEFRRQVEAQSN